LLPAATEPLLAGTNVSTPNYRKGLALDQQTGADDFRFAYEVCQAR